jgi:uncharacterized protein YdiU (UPF0061 family)
MPSTPATTDPTIGLFQFDNSYARLGDRFSERQDPTPVASPSLVQLNRSLAVELGLDPTRLESVSGVEVLAGNRVPNGAEPLAQAYAGHQFGGFVPQLGDGRAILLGELQASDGRRDVQLKGAGRTPFSRGGDGRASLGPVLREYLVSESMHALGIPTTRALAATTTGEPVMRDSALPGAVITRIAASHIRVGTVQYFASRGEAESVITLANYVIERHYPAATDDKYPALAMLREVMARQAELVARWLGVGFIHGVMNTDNTTLSGETIDYGPCAFMDVYDPATVFSSIDRRGRYAYGSQPGIAGWNMARLAEALLPAIAPTRDEAIELAQATVGEFPSMFDAAWLRVMRDKLGLHDKHEQDGQLLQSLFDAMAAGQADFTATFRALCQAADDAATDSAVRDLFTDPNLYDGWAVQWRERLAAEAPGTGRGEAMRQVNPAFIPRNHLVEAALSAAIDDRDLEPFETLLAVLARPHDDQPEHAAMAEVPSPTGGEYRTFCGT